jgi:hypothetical protein
MYGKIHSCVFVERDVRCWMVFVGLIGYILIHDLVLDSVRI